MSSRLNPRDYDLGELRDAVRENSRPDDARRAGRCRDRRDDREREASGRESDHRHGERPVGSGADLGVDLGGSRGADRSHDREPRGESRRAPPVLRTIDGVRGRPSSADERGRSRENPPAGVRDQPETAGVRATEVSQEVLELLLQFSRDGVDRPYLTRLPDGYGAQREVFEWLEGLLSKCGREATIEALSYYGSLGWLSEGSREHLERFTAGLTAAAPSNPRSLDVDDHRRSLLYVARLTCRLHRDRDR